MIDGGSYVNINSKSAVEKMGLKTEPHPQTHVTHNLFSFQVIVIVFGVISYTWTLHVSYLVDPAY